MRALYKVIRQTEKNRCLWYHITYMWNKKKRQSHRNRVEWRLSEQGDGSEMRCCPVMSSSMSPALYPGAPAPAVQSGWPSSCSSTGPSPPASSPPASPTSGTRLPDRGFAGCVARGPRWTSCPCKVRAEVEGQGCGGDKGRGLTCPRESEWEESWAPEAGQGTWQGGARP